MARMAHRIFLGLIAAASIVLALPAAARAGDAIAGFLVDSETQYFTYAGVADELPWEKWGLIPYWNWFGAAQGYTFDGGADVVDATQQFFVPALGVKKRLGALTLSTHIGPRFRWKKEESSISTGEREFDTHVFVEAQAFYWHERYNAHAILSYGGIDDFFFGRLRTKYVVFGGGEKWPRLEAGWDIGGMGNVDFSAFRTGPVLEVPFFGVAFLARGGYQHDSNFGSIGYGGLELYSPW